MTRHEPEGGTVDSTHRPASQTPPADNCRDLREQLEHAKAALAGDNEGIRLWMLDCARLAHEHHAHVASAEAKFTRIRDRHTRVHDTDPDGFGMNWCAECGSTDDPCPTVHILDDTEAG